MGFLSKLFKRARRPLEPRLIVCHPVSTKKQLVSHKIEVKKLGRPSVFRIGRGEEGQEINLRLQQNPLTSAVAARHWEFQTDASGRCWVKDLGTNEGTLVNGGFVYSTRCLQHGDVITSGAEEAESRVAVIFDSTGELSEKLSTREELFNHLKKKGVVKSK